MMYKFLLVFFVILMLCHVAVSEKKEKKPFPYNVTLQAAKYDNPNFVKDRKKEMSKPQMPLAWKNRNKQPFHPAWMDYCAPYHCDDYHKLACGLNRNTMKFKYFKSQCHIILNNQCAYFRGLLKYDIVEVKYCDAYVMQLRSGCPQFCDRAGAPVCAWGRSSRPHLFRNHCEYERANCNDIIQEYEEVSMRLCHRYWYSQDVTIQ